MKIKIPSIQEQRRLVFEESIKEAVEQFQEYLNAPAISEPLEVDESEYPNTHLLREREGWEPPDPDLVRAYFSQFQRAFEEYDTDKKLSHLLGLSSNRRIREFKAGEYKVPYGIWRKFLVMTGRAPQDIIPVLGFFP